ncbi:DUF1415 domain-containing protein [Acidovorax sp. FJL06]|uniref:DUF1415 domain-containing protein n=1 Tax=Acidovorax sp. FJL06 TaxID=2153365 RepID=UPI000F55F921|nr:DUF1415 domain-containing protein [Acidovorax sp. FJL06]RQO83845.1 DUF1415 domain-containing protein [Acidovorax sp. FJL06]
MGALDPAAPFIHDTVRWLEKAVIGLNLCPFAKGVHVKGQVHYAVALTDNPAAVLERLREELLALQSTPAEVRDTTLLVVPHCLQDFLDFNDFLGEAENLLDTLALDGVLQIASFHPQFQFAGTEVDDVTNCTNRAPYPTLHLLREDSIDRAVEVFPEAEAIFERNMEVLEGLGMAGWQALDVGPQAPRPGTAPADGGRAR